MRTYPGSLCASVAIAVGMLIAFGSAIIAHAQSGPPTTDIWLFEMDGAEVSPLTRVTDGDVYDNQPAFTEDGGRLLFVSARTGRANVFSYDIASGETTQLTFTDADKYSPTPIPGTQGRAFSVVHSDSVVHQGLWRYSVDGATKPEPIADVDAVAYYDWVGNDHVLYWRLTTPPTVQLLDIRSSESVVLADDSAYSFKRIPGERATSYLARAAGQHSEIRRFDWDSRETTVIAPTLGEGRDHTWAPDGRLLMLSGGELHAFTPGTSDGWEFIAELGLEGGTRIAVSPDGSLIAVVGVHKNAE